MASFSIGKQAFGSPMMLNEFDHGTVPLAPSLSVEILSSSGVVLMPERERRAFFNVLLKECSTSSRQLHPQEGQTSQDQDQPQRGMFQSVTRLRRAITEYSIP